MSWTISMRSKQLKIWGMVRENFNKRRQKTENKIIHIKRRSKLNSST